MDRTFSLLFGHASIVRLTLQNKILRFLILIIESDNTFQIDMSCKMEESDKALQLTTTLEKLR